MLTIKSQKAIRESIEEAVRIAGEAAYQKGFEDGLRKGLMQDKEGIHLNSTGMYVFKDGNIADVKPNEN